MNAFAAVQTAYSCEEADKIKFSKDAYLALDPTERVFLDATWQSCQTPKEQDGKGCGHQHPAGVEGG